jgi:hypothetical protein
MDDHRQAVAYPLKCSVHAPEITERVRSIVPEGTELFYCHEGCYLGIARNAYQRLKSLRISDTESGVKLEKLRGLLREEPLTYEIDVHLSEPEEAGSKQSRFSLAMLRLVQKDEPLEDTTDAIWETMDTSDIEGSVCNPICVADLSYAERGEWRNKAHGDHRSSWLQGSHTYEHEASKQRD